MKRKKERKEKENVKEMPGRGVADLGVSRLLALYLRPCGMVL